MSAFLGKIHYWLFNKIDLHEKLINGIVKAEEDKGYNSENLLKESYSKYGSPVKGELEDEIDHSNIHGWLQERIISVESRLAFIITEILKNNILKQEEIADIFYNNGASSMKELDLSECLPQDLFKVIFDYMLEGMPCDRVNEIIENNEDTIKWKTTRDLHKEYWEAAQGDVNNFYLLRESWINGFLEASGMDYKYTRDEDGINIIKRG